MLKKLGYAQQQSPVLEPREQVRLAILMKLAYDPYYTAMIERNERRRRRTNIARALELGGLGAMLAAQPLRGQNRALARQLSTMGAIAMGAGGATNILAGNVAEGLVFGGIPLIGLGGIRTMNWRMDVNAGDARGFWRGLGYNLGRIPGTVIHGSRDLGGRIRRGLNTFWNEMRQGFNDTRNNNNG
jgi:hypothetical protein